MSSPPGSPRQPATPTISFIRSTNPDVFRIRPRPGGVVPIGECSFATSTKIGEEDFARDLQMKINETVSKEFRVQTALDEDDVSLGSEDATVPNPLKDTMYMFGVTISTLIMLANKQSDIPPEYIQWTSQCLDCIRDDFGNHPPNVQGILNHIRMLDSKGGTGAAAPPAEEPAGEPDEEGEQTIRTTTTVKLDNEDQ